MCTQPGCGNALLSTNVGDAELREKGNVLLVGTCALKRYPSIVEEYAKKDVEKAILPVCMEEVHMNHAGYKIASIVRYAHIRKLTALTIDGSPHCVQLHYVVEDIQRHFTPEIETEHFVIEKGEVVRISPTAVKRSRHLSKIERNIQ